MKQETKTSKKPAQPTLTLDVDLYQHHLDNSDLTDEQKKELLQTIWNVVCSFVQLGFNVHPMQQALSENSGKDAITALTPTYGDSDGLKCHRNKEECKDTGA